MSERRPAGRGAEAVRETRIERDIQRNSAGSVLISTGNTRVICAASVEHRVPPWMKQDAKRRGWVTAEYRMLPGSSGDRIRRGQNSRATEIQRLIGRSLRGIIDLEKIPGLTITVDCDVLDADGGTRTASITGGWVALVMACRKLLAEGTIAEDPITGQLAAVSVGMVGGEALCDLDYPEDSAADVDMNVVGSPDGALVEVQGTAEGRPFDRAQLDVLLDLAQNGMVQLGAAQRAALAG